MQALCPLNALLLSMANGTMRVRRLLLLLPLLTTQSSLGTGKLADDVNLNDSQTRNGAHKNLHRYTVVLVVLTPFYLLEMYSIQKEECKIAKYQHK